MNRKAVSASSALLGKLQRKTASHDVPVEPFQIDTTRVQRAVEVVDRVFYGVVFGHQID